MLGTQFRSIISVLIPIMDGMALNAGNQNNSRHYISFKNRPGPAMLPSVHEVRCKEAPGAADLDSVPCTASMAQPLALVTL